MKNALLWLIPLLVFSCQPSSKNGDKKAGKKEDVALDLSPEDISKAAYVVPSPGEVFASLDKLGDVPWASLATYNEKTNYSSKQSKSLNLGVRVADAFIAIQSEDKANFGKMSSAVIDLGNALGIEDISSDRNALNLLVQAGQWDAISAGLDNVQARVQQDVKNKGDKEVMALANAGGWLEGLRAVSKYLTSSYTVEKSKLLSQGGLVQHINAELKPFVKSGDLVSSVASTMDEIAKIIGTTEQQAISKENIIKLNELSNRAVERIVNSN